MIKKVNFDQVQQEIIREICLIQIESLDNVLAQEIDILTRMSDKGINVSLKDIQDEVASGKRVFEQLRNSPSSFQLLDHIHLSTFKHILLNFYDEEEMPDSDISYRKSLAGLWKKLFLMDFLKLHQQ